MHDLGTVVPGGEEFLQLAQDHRVIPVTMTLLADSHTPLSIYRALATDESGAARPGTFLMESAAPGAAWSRHSFIGVRTSATLSEKDGAAHWIGEPPVGTPRQGSTAAVLRDTLEFLSSTATGAARRTAGRPFIEELPHLTSGLVGYAGWDVIRHWEKLPHPPVDDLQVPEMAMNLVSDLAVHDNRDGTVTLVANAINFDGQDTGAERAYTDAVARLHQMSAQLAEPVAPVVSTAQPEWGAAVQQDLTDGWSTPGTRTSTWPPWARPSRPSSTARSSRSWSPAGSRWRPRSTPSRSTDAAAAESQPLHVSDALRDPGR